MNAEDLIESLLKYPDVPVMVKIGQHQYRVLHVEPVEKRGEVESVVLFVEGRSENPEGR